MECRIIVIRSFQNDQKNIYFFYQYTVFSEIQEKCMVYNKFSDWTCPNSHFHNIFMAEQRT